MTTLMILVAEYGATGTLPFRTVAQDVFGIDPALFLRRLKSGKINALGEDPANLKRNGVPLSWLADTIDTRRQMAREKLNSTSS